MRSTSGKSLYFVWQGRKTGLFSDWIECSRQVDGDPYSMYMGFEDISGMLLTVFGIGDAANTLIAYTKCCQHNQKGNRFAVVGTLCRYIAFTAAESVTFVSKKENGDTHVMPYHNIIGELLGVIKALDYAKSNKIKSVVILHEANEVSLFAPYNLRKKSNKHLLQGDIAVKDIVASKYGNSDTLIRFGTKYRKYLEEISDIDVYFGNVCHYEYKSMTDFDQHNVYAYELAANGNIELLQKIYPKSEFFNEARKAQIEEERTVFRKGLDEREKDIELMKKMQGILTPKSYK